jgi:histidyl-tRNA synthetase
MKDIISTESKKFIYFVDNASKIAKKYGYDYIETPLLEETALFKRSVGESSDIVNKEMYQFIDKGENDVCLRPEGTAGVVRCFTQNKFDKAGGTHRYYYYGPMFRYERPQKGRLREFHQFGCESFGIASVYEDANIILMIKEIFDFFGIKHSIKLNSLGCKECMPLYRDTLVEKLETMKDKLCEDCNNRINTNPIRVLDCKVDSCQALLNDVPTITSSLCGCCDDDFEKLKSILESEGVSYEIDCKLVRGLDYYSKTAFEFVSDEIGAQSAIAGGGRYDRLVEFLDGSATPAVGFAIGIERIMDLIPLDESIKDGYYFGAMSEEALDRVFSLAANKRKETKVIMEYKSRNFNKHLKGAEKANARYCVLVGEDELKNSTVWIKDMQSKEEKTISAEEL